MFLRLRVFCFGVTWLGIEMEHLDYWFPLQGKKFVWKQNFKFFIVVLWRNIRILKKRVVAMMKGRIWHSDCLWSKGWEVYAFFLYIKKNSPIYALKWWKSLQKWTHLDTYTRIDFYFCLLSLYNLFFFLLPSKHILFINQ